MNVKTSLLISLLSIAFIGPVSAAPPAEGANNQTGADKDVQRRIIGPDRIAGPSSGTQGVERSAAVNAYQGPDLSTLGSADPSAQALSSNCTWWWVHGKHTYKWKNYWFYGYNKLDASTWTTYGTSTASCGTALIVDVIKVKGNTVGAGFNAIVNKTAYNTSSVSDSDRVDWVGSGGNACGARVDHTATKSGITWSTHSRSGCG